MVEPTTFQRDAPPAQFSAEEVQLLYEEPPPLQLPPPTLSAMPHICSMPELAMTASVTSIQGRLVIFALFADPTVVGANPIWRDAGFGQRIDGVGTLHVQVV